MIEFWNQWWMTPTALSLLTALVWALWTYASAVPTELPPSGSDLLASEARWIRWCGWLAGVSGRTLTVKSGPGLQWTRLHAEHAEPMREVERANRARFAPAVLLALITAVLGVAQGAFTLVCLALAPGSPWLIVSLFLAGWSTLPLFVTWTLMRRWWIRRRLFEWSFLQSADDLLRNYEEDRTRRRGDPATLLDAIEESLADRFARTPLDLPSHADRARRWQSRSAPLLTARPEAGDRAAVLTWIERCSALIRSRWDRPRLIRRGAAPTMTAKAPLPSSIGIRFAASLIVVFVNTALFVIILVVQNPSPRIHVITDILADPALIAGITIAAFLAQGIASGARAFTRWTTK